MRRALLLVSLLGAGALALTACTQTNAVDSKAVARRRQAIVATPNPAQEELSGTQLEQAQQRTMGGRRY